ncbi:MAG: GNAT family N-acetyltransferase, partial [Gemmatimonadaceae bacterium]
ETLTVGPYKGSAEAWDDFVRARGGARHYTHCHLYGWRPVMQQALGHDAPYLVALDDSSGAIRGVLPLVRIKSMLFGHFLVSVPFVNYGGPIGTPSAIGALLTYAARMADLEGAKILELRSRYDMGEFAGFDVSHRKITVLMDSSGGSDALWKRLPSKLRSQIRRPQKEGVTVRIGLDQAAPFYRVFSRHMRDLGTPVMPWSFFQSVVREFSDSALFAVAYHEGIPIACGGGFSWGCAADREFEITWASSLREYNRMSPNMLVYWELMKHISDNGVSTFNFGRCTPGGNTHKFKTQWGTTDQPLWWYEHAASGARPMTERSAGAGVATRLWKYMPLGVANVLGPRLVRLIPL